MAAILSAAVVVLAAAFLLAGFAGVAPWSNSMPFAHRADVGGSTPQSYFQAEAVAALLTASWVGGPWSAVAAEGLALPTAVTIPGSNASNSTPFSPCVPTLGGVGGHSSVSIPATPSSAAPGLAAAWFLTYADAGGNLTLVSVLQGHVSVLQSIAAQPCTLGIGQIHAISPSSIDSTKAAAIADAWGGTAFRANFTGSAAIYAIQGSETVSIGPLQYGYPNATGGGSTWINGTPPPPPIPPGWNTSNYTIPSGWSVMYSTCTLPSSCAGVGWTPQGFAASIDALNGSVRDVIAFVGGTGPVIGYPGVVVNTPLARPLEL
ncbi:MAG: hypothetical protein L3K19_09275 [Thermoplasmata archaeon]|nr:hypothetical protein [Thermoplasmata archaeon]